MAFNNEQVLSQIVNPAEKAVFKSMREDMETGKALLNPEQLGMFLRAATLNQTILRDAPFDILNSFENQYADTLESALKTVKHYIKDYGVFIIPSFCKYI